MLPDLYAVLNIDRQATPEEIRKAYKQQALQLHPDINKAPDAHEQFVGVGQAYYLLSDETRKTAYDKYLKEREEAEKGGKGRPLATEEAVNRWCGEAEIQAGKHAGYTFAEFSGEIIVGLLGDGIFEVVIDGICTVVKGTGVVLGEVISNIDL